MSDSKDGVFLGLAKEDQEAVAEWRQARFETSQQSYLESDVSVSSIATDDLSDITDSNKEETWNVNKNPSSFAIYCSYWPKFWRC